MVGSYPHGDLGRWSSGFGFGGQIPIGRRLFLNVDFITRGVTYTDESEDEIWLYDEQTVLNKLRFANCALRWAGSDTSGSAFSVAFRSTSSSQIDGTPRISLCCW